MTNNKRECVDTNTLTPHNPDTEQSRVGMKWRMRSGSCTVPFCLVFAFFFSLSCVVCGDDTPAVRDTFSSLCSINRGSVFSSCCGEHPASSIDLRRRESWSCYANELKVNENGDLISMFVLFSLLSFFLSFHHECFYFLGIFPREGLRTLENVVFPI